MEEMFDYVVLVTADEKIREARKEKSGGMSPGEFKRRNDNQIPDIEKKKAADFVFENNSSVEDLEKKVDLMLMMLTGSVK